MPDITCVSAVREGLGMPKTNTLATAQALAGHNTCVVAVAAVVYVMGHLCCRIYTQLSKQLGKVFFPSGDPVLQALSFWGV